MLSVKQVQKPESPAWSFLSIFRHDVNEVILRFLKEDLAGVFLIKLELHI